MRLANSLIRGRRKKSPFVVPGLLALRIARRRRNAVAVTLVETDITTMDIEMLLQGVAMRTIVPLEEGAFHPRIPMDELTTVLNTSETRTTRTIIMLAAIAMKLQLRVALHLGAECVWIPAIMLQVEMGEAVRGQKRPVIFLIVALISNRRLMIAGTNMQNEALTNRFSHVYFNNISSKLLHLLEMKTLLGSQSRSLESRLFFSLPSSSDIVVLITAWRAVNTWDRLRLRVPEV